MNLSNEEKQFYQDLFLKHIQSGQPLKQANCLAILNKGLHDSALSDNIWALVSNHGSRQTLKKRDFLRMLKYISASQNGYRIEEIVLKDLPQLPVPCLQKKRGAENAKESLATESQGDAIVPEVQVSEEHQEREAAKENSPARESLKSCESTEGPASNLTLSPDRHPIEEQPVFEGQNEMLVDLVEKNEHIDHNLVGEAELKVDVSEKFESPENVEKDDQETTNQIISDNVEQVAPKDDKVIEEEKIQEVPEEDVIVTEVQQEDLKPEEPQVEIVEPEKDDTVQVVEEDANRDKPEDLPEDELIINAPQEENPNGGLHEEEVVEVEHNDAVQVIGDEEIASGDEKAKEIPEPVIFVTGPSETEAQKKAAQEQIMGLSNQLHRLKKAESVAKEQVKSPHDDDERRSKDSVSSSRASESSRRSQASTDSNSKIMMNLLKYKEYMEQNQKIKVEIRDTITYNNGFLGYGTYTSYLIRSKYPDSDILEAERRFSDFDWLNSYFQSHPPYKGLVLPTLPEKKSIGNNDPGFIQQRKNELDRYLKEIALHKILSQDPVLRTFLGEKGREGFQSLKERIQVSGLGLPELDWRKIKEACEYAMASVKVKLQKESVLDDWKDSNERIYDVLRIDGMVKKLLKTLQKRQELYKSVKNMNVNLNVFHMKIMNRVEKESYHAIGSLSSLMMAQAQNMHDESFITDNLAKHIKVFRSKVDGCKNSYALLISTLQEIETNKELTRNKQGKLFEHKAEKNVNGIALVTKEISEIEKKIETLEKESRVIQSNLDLEAEALVELFDIYLPDALNFFNIQQTDQFEKVSKTWEGISQE